MLPTSHRIRVQERRLVRRLLLTLGLSFTLLMFIIFAGLPLLAKVILVTTSFRTEKNATANTSDTSLLFPPELDPIAEATNSSPIRISGFSIGDAEVVIFVNDKKVAKVKTDNSGRFLSNTIALDEGGNNITAVVVKDKKDSSPSSTLTITYKKSAPKLTLEISSDGQKVTTDSNGFDIVGETDPGNKVTVNDRVVIVSPSGKFRYTVSLSTGENVFKIEATDDAGNNTTEERKVEYRP